MKRSIEEISDYSPSTVNSKKVFVESDDEFITANENYGHASRDTLTRLATKARQCLSKRLEDEGIQDERNEEYDKAVALQKSLLTDAEWPQDLFVEVVDVGSSISHIIPPDSAESASSKVYLLVYPTVCHWNDLSGPFRPVRMVVSPLTGEWKITVNLTDVISEGNCSINYDELISVAKEHFSEGHVLCRGIQGYEDIQARLGYTPKSVKVSSWPWMNCHSTECKLWYVPKTRNVQKDDNVCSPCHEQMLYMGNRLKSHDLTEEERLQRQSTSSHLPERYLSPESKKARLDNKNRERKKLLKIVERYRKRTLISLSGKQNGEFAKLLDVIDRTEEGQRELNSIVEESNERGNVEVEGKLIKRGELIKEMWNQEKFLLIKDQHRNGTSITF